MFVRFTLAVLLLRALGVVAIAPGAARHDAVTVMRLKFWSERLSKDLLKFSDFITNGKQAQQSYNESNVESRSGSALAEQMALSLGTAMASRRSAAEHIAAAAERLAAEHQENSDLYYRYYRSEGLSEGTDNYTTPSPDDVLYPSEMILNDYSVWRPPPLKRNLTQSPHFQNVPVDQALSSVHVAGDVHEWRLEIIRAIQWSTGLDEVFLNNYHNDPSLSWQVFGSLHGILRHYPARQWLKSAYPRDLSEMVDVYDCRFRSWYLESAASPRELLIMVDNSGSMNGTNFIMAKMLATILLETLGNDDFVNVFMFNSVVTPVVPCFNNSLIQATFVNVREIVSSFTLVKTGNVAKFDIALPFAFKMLHKFKITERGTKCNQAIVMITDYFPEGFEDVVAKYNGPQKSTRFFIFSVGLGGSVPQVVNSQMCKRIACSNRGFYAEMHSVEDVRSQALNVLDIMARPLVLQENEHPASWTGLYASGEDQRIADHLWYLEENEDQKERYFALRRDKKYFTSSLELSRRFLLKDRLTNGGHYDDSDHGPYELMTSVSVPAYDLRKFENITELHLGKKRGPENITIRIAKILGVAAVDFPIRDITVLLKPYMLGVNGYCFVITNNGQILLHPYMRPAFEKILKPNYRSLDMVEVELMDDDRPPRNFSPELLKFRKEIVDFHNGSKWMQTKYHMDDMQRVSRMRRQYFWYTVPGCPFTVVASVPEAYGRTRVSPPSSALRLNMKHAGEALQILKTFDAWSLHPEWLYCKYYDQVFPNKKEELLHFLERMTEPDWNWVWDRSGRGFSPWPGVTGKNYPYVYFRCVSSVRLLYTSLVRSRLESGSIIWSPHEAKYGLLIERVQKTFLRYLYMRRYGERELMLMLIYDVRILEWYHHAHESKPGEESTDDHPLICQFGSTTSFLATQSGLTMWRKHISASELNPTVIEFGSRWPRAIEESWYRRAVEQHAVDSRGIVLTGDVVHAIPDVLMQSRAKARTTKDKDGKVRVKTEYWLMGSQAIVHSEDESRAAPAAVVGFRFQLENFLAFFDMVTSSCEYESATCGPTCISDDWACFIVDEHGYLVASEEPQDVGKLLGEVRPSIMHTLVEDGIYRAVPVVDYQAVCFRKSPNMFSPANRLFTPLATIYQILSWTFSTVAWLVTCGINLSGDVYGHLFAEGPVKFPTPAPNKTKVKKVKKKKMLVEALFTKDVLVNRTIAQACDRQKTLYLFQHSETSFNKLTLEADGCKRPFVANMIPETNLVIVAVDDRCWDETASFITDRLEVQYNESLPCARNRYYLHRKRPDDCINYHMDEGNVTLCSNESNYLHAYSILYIGALHAILSYIYYL